MMFTEGIQNHLHKCQLCNTQTHLYIKVNYGIYTHKYPLCTSCEAAYEPRFDVKTLKVSFILKHL